MKKIIFILIFEILISFVFTVDKNNRKNSVQLSLTQSDIILIENGNLSSVYDLYVKKYEGAYSIGIYVDDEQYNDPDLFIIRAKSSNLVNSNEVRFVRNKKSKERMQRLPNALISSTVVHHEILGDCFHIQIPSEMYYGYVIQEQHECIFENGMTVNIRAFSKKGCDPTGLFQDNKVQLIVSDYNTEKSFNNVSGQTGGETFKVTSHKDLTEKLVQHVNSLDVSEQIELVFLFDATASMKDDFVELKKNWLPLFKNQYERFSNLKLGLVFYKDYGSDFYEKKLPVKTIGFVDSFNAFSKQIKKISVKGGGDEEEAVYEGLYSCLNEIAWTENCRKKIILVGDSGPHATNLSSFKITEADLIAECNKKNISIDCFLISETGEKSGKISKTVKKTEISRELKSSVEELNAK